MPTNIVITNAGRAALVNAQNTGTLPVVITQVGLSQTAVSPAATATTLPGEFKRVSGIGGEAIAPDTIHINMSDTTADVYSLRSFALYLADGTLFGIYGQAAPMLEKVAASDALLAIDVVFADISAASLTFGNTNYLNPPATTERQGVVELATVAEAQAGIDALRALTPSSAKAAILGWLLAQDGSGSGLDADLLDGLHASAFARLIGANFTGDVNVVGTGGASAAMNTNGDITANRGNNTGVYYFTGSGTRYLYFNGGGFDLIGGQLAINSYIAWNAGNDGSGSGLDADYLDGLDSTQFFRANANVFNHRSSGANGYLQSNEGNGANPGYVSFHTVEGIRRGFVGWNNGASRMVLASETGWGWAFYDTPVVGASPMWHAGNDGAGSGLDADLLDGYDSSYFVNIPARLGYTPVQQGTGIGQLPNIVKIGWAGSRVKVTVDTTDIGNVVFDANISDVWRASNDGSGSGLDADLLDGYHAAAFRRIVQRNPAENGGFYVYDDGIIEAWGYVDVYPNSGAVFTLPVQHQAWVIPTMARLQSRYGDTLNTENIYLTSIDVDGSGRPVSLTIWNSDNFTNRVFIHTKGY